MQGELKQSLGVRETEIRLQGCQGGYNLQVRLPEKKMLHKEKTLKQGSQTLSVKGRKMFQAFQAIHRLLNSAIKTRKQTKTIHK